MSDHRPLLSPARVEDEHLNIICLGGRLTGPMLAWDLAEAFLGSSLVRWSVIRDACAKLRRWKHETH